MENLLPLLVVVPLGAGFVIPVIGLFGRKGLPEAVALVAVAALVVLSGATFAGGDTVVSWMGGWQGGPDPQGITGIVMVCDGLSRLLLLIINVIAAVAMLFSVSYMQRYTKVSLYYSPLFLMIAGMNGIVLSGDIFNIYVFLEIAAISSYALVGFGVESEELEASFKYLVLSAVASSFILLGIGIVYNLTGTLNLAQIAISLEETGLNKAAWLAMGFFVAGFGLKAAMVPFHAWLPDAHPSAPAPISAMLSGVLIKATGIYVLGRLVFNTFGVSASLGTVLMVLGMASMLVGVFLAVGQWDLKRLLAYHSISQMGYVMLAFGVGVEALAAGVVEVGYLAVFSGLFHLANHAVFKSLLFLCSGSYVYSTGTRNLKKISAILRRMPLTGACTRIASLSISGVPPFNGFFSKLLITIAVVWAGHPFLGALTALVSFATLLSFTKVQRYLVAGASSDAPEVATEPPASMQASLVILATLCLAMGLLVPIYRFVLLDPASGVLVNGLRYAASVFGG